MEFKESKIRGVYEILLDQFSDKRGSFSRIYDAQLFVKFGLPHSWVQENLSINSQLGVIRGLHFLLPPHTDGKLIRCSKGEIFDVSIDLRKGSETFGKWIAFNLHEDDNTMIYIPKGFAHGFCSLTEKSELVYKHDSFYIKDSDCGIKWNDEILNIDWPIQNPIISEKDSKLMMFKEFTTIHGGL